MNSGSPMRPFGKPRSTLDDVAVARVVTVHQITAAGGDAKGKDEIDCFFEAIRSIALPTMLQEAAAAEAYVRSLPWASYLRIEATVHAYRLQFPETGDVAVLFAVWKEFRRILIDWIFTCLAAQEPNM